FQRYTGIHQCQAGTTDRSHGAGTIGFSDLTDNAQGVREAVLRRQNRSNTATGKTTVTDLTTTGCAHATTLAYSIGWEVVVQHEGIFPLAFQCINHLNIAGITQRGNYQRLSFTTSKQG